MAQRVLVELLDDIDGSEAIGTLAFSFEGEEIHVDLSQDHMEEYNQILSYLKSVGRVVGKKKRAPYGSKKATTVVGKTQEMREWLRAQGHDVKDRGRVPAGLVKLWEERSQGEAKVIGEDDMREVVKSLNEKAPEKPVEVTETASKGKTTRKPAAARKKPTAKESAPATAEMAAILAFKEPEAPKTTRKRTSKTTSTQV